MEDLNETEPHHWRLMLDYEGGVELEGSVFLVRLLGGAVEVLTPN